LYGGNVSSLEALRAQIDGEFHLLTFGQGLVAAHLDYGELDKNIRAAFALDEGKTLAAVEPLDRADYTFAHFETPSGTKKD
jgi:hypothetical protein